MFTIQLDSCIIVMRTQLTRPCLDHLQIPGKSQNFPFYFGPTSRYYKSDEPFVIFALLRLSSFLNSMTTQTSSRLRHSIVKQGGGREIFEHSRLRRAEHSDPFRKFSDCISSTADGAKTWYRRAPGHLCNLG